MVSFFDLPDDVLSNIIYYTIVYNNINNDSDIIDYYKQLLCVKLSCKYYFKMFNHITLFDTIFNQFKFNNPFPLRKKILFECCLSCSSSYRIPYNDLYCNYCMVSYDY
jgi:hypothetical protein